MAWGYGRYQLSLKRGEEISEEKIEYKDTNSRVVIWELEPRKIKTSDQMKNTWA